MSQLYDNIKKVYRRISRAAMIAERDPQGITLVAVSKTVSAERLIQAANYGIRIFAESRVQEAVKKIEEFNQLNEKHGFDNISWHMIGTLQKNKVKAAVSLFDLIHSVDCILLAQEIDKHALRIGKIQRILLQVKLSEEESKHGIDEADVLQTLDKISGLSNIKCEGLMTIPPYCEEPENCRSYFIRLREIFNHANEQGFALKELSMGMSHDFEIAIQEGATLIRVGTAIFDTRGDPLATSN